MRPATDKGAGVFGRCTVALLFCLVAPGIFAQTAEVKAKLKALRPADFPSRPIELSVGFPPGGGMDVVARMIAQKFQDYTGETAIVSNRSGAGGLIFHRWMVTQAPSDGHSVGVANNIMISDSLLRAEGKWSYRDADPIAFINSEPLLWFVSTSGRFGRQSLVDILTSARRDPGGLKVGTLSGGPPEMLAEQVEQKAAIGVTKVPFNGGKVSITALLGNHIDIAYGFMGETKGLSDKLRPIAVASEHPVTALPGVPTFNETLKTADVAWGVWRYIVAPKGVPEARKAWLVAAFNEVLKDPSLVAELEKAGGISEPGLDTPAKVSAELDRQAASERSFYVHTGRLK